MATGDRASGLTPYERVFLGIAVTVTIVWAIATAVQIITPSRPVPEYANLVMMTVAGSFFGGAVITSRGRKRKNGQDGDDDPYSGPGGYYREHHSKR